MKNRGMFHSIRFSLARSHVALLTVTVALAATLLVSVWAGTGPVGAQDGSEAPAKPTGLRVSTEQGSLNVALDWDDVDGAARYWVRWRSVDSGEKLNEGISVQSSGVSITVANYGEWVARVQACNDTGCGKPLAERFTVEPDPQATPTPTATPTPEPVPTQPAGLRVSTEQGTLNVALDWDDVDGAARYWVRWRSVDNGEKLNDGISVQSSGVSITVANYGEWVVRVQGCNDTGCGKPLAERFTVVPAPQPTSTWPPVPGRLRVSVEATLATPVVGQRVVLRAAISNAPVSSLYVPRHIWEISVNGGSWHRYGTGPAVVYLADYPLIRSFRVTIIYNAGVSATSAPFTVTWVEPTPTPTPTLEPTATPTPEPTATLRPHLLPLLRPHLLPRPRLSRLPRPRLTPTATPTPTPTATPTPEPTATPTPEPAPAALRLAPVLDADGRMTRTFTVNWDSVQGAASYTLNWWQDEDNSQSQSQIASTTRQARAPSGDSAQEDDSQSVNRRTFPAGQTSADINVPRIGKWNVNLQALNDEGGVVAQGSNQIELNFYGTDNVFINYWYEWPACQTTPRNRIGAKPVNGGVEIRWHKDNQPVTKHQYIFRIGVSGLPLYPQPVWKDIPGGDVDSYTIRGLKSGVTYTVFLRTVTDGRYCVEWQVYVTPIDPTIDAITGLSAARAPNQNAAVKLTWDDPGDDRLDGGAGADAMDGGAGSDTAYYSDSAAAVTVDLSSSGAQSGGHAQGDTLSNIENIVGSDHADTLTGDPSDNILRGGAGADTLDGGAGSDTADYSGSPLTAVEGQRIRLVGVIVKLASGDISAGHAQGDTLSNIENIIGSDHSDLIVGDASANVIRGDADTDFLYGGGGQDWILGDAGDDTLYGGPDLDRFQFRVEQGIGTDIVEDYSIGEDIEICRKYGTQPFTLTYADVGSDYVITVIRSGKILGTITLKGITSKSPGFVDPTVSRTTETGSCWGGGEYIWK